MAEEVKNNQAPEVKKEVEKTIENPVENPTEEKPLAEVLQPEAPKEKPESVPLEVLKMSRKENSELKQKLKELEDKISSGANNKEVSEDIDAIADEYQVDKSFLKKVENSIRAKLEKDVEDKIHQTLKPIEDEKNARKRDEILEQHLNEVLENKPDFKGIANKEVIKALAVLPQNKNKTLSQLLEETYGNALGGKRTIETTTPRGGKEITEIDFDKARQDPEYFREIKSNPDLLKKYNDGLPQRISW